MSDQMARLVILYSSAASGDPPPSGPPLLIRFRLLRSSFQAMVGWQRNCIQSLTRHFGKARLLEATSTPQTQESLLRRPFYHYSQHSGISSSRNLLSDSSSNVPSPNTLNPPPPSLKQVQYVLKGVTQLCGARGDVANVAKGVFWQPRKGLSFVLTFETERDRNAAILLARKYALDCNVMIAGPDDRV